MIKFNMLFKNEHDCVIEADTVQQARNLWKNREQGTWKEATVLRDPKKLRAIKMVPAK